MMTRIEQLRLRNDIAMSGARGFFRASPEAQYTPVGNAIALRIVRSATQPELPAPARRKSIRDAAACVQYDIYPSSQYVTVYATTQHFSDGTPMPLGTLNRRRVYAQGPAWTLYATNGKKLRDFYLPPTHASVARAFGF